MRNLIRFWFKAVEFGGIAECGDAGAAGD